jgi:phage portal protein BeeE
LKIFAGLTNSIKSAFSRIKNLSVLNPKAWNTSFWNLFGSQSLSGENVTEHTALTYSAVWNAVQLISGTVSTLPLHLCRKDQRKTIFVIEKKLFRVLHDRFNPYMTAQVGREVMMAHILLWGNGYAEIVRNGYGEFVELWPIPPHRV